MRHRVAGRRLGRDSEHRLAMRRNIVASLFEHETISTTIEKAKEVKSFAEKLITLAKKGTLPARRRAIALLGNRDIVNKDGEKEGTVIGKLFSEIGPRYLDRPGGYTRIIRLSLKRLGDNGQLVLLQLIGEDESTTKGKKTTTKKASRKKHKETIERSIAQEEVELSGTEESVDTKSSEEAVETQEQKESTEAESSEEKSDQQQ